ncbi:MAG: UDP-N-acetylglucosamine--N-acetylmuramyl-(pentapeptide) pyrophosphoryl-undecaprenol N-acetylglucosamine transferase [Microbacteriaceae bacterium]|nr:UDP-N-acetylglucosamine--N-acetylmuramyl-(pentapeptide) pyrophosphoryl-undecaprenol N-acetylglucosamine transferase [Microbacteriaceae bacterium]
MTVYLLAGGGTAGHVNPLLATADRLRDRDPGSEVLVLGTAEGLEARLVPGRGYELLTIPRTPFPRRPNGDLLRFPGRWRATIEAARTHLRERGVDVVAGFGGYASAPAYRAARREGLPIAVHEANARPGLANRLGARLTRHVGVTFPGTPLRNAQVVGFPLRREIETLDRAHSRAAGAAEFGLDAARPTLLVTGGSSGARRINETVAVSVERILGAGWQVLHLSGGLREALTDPGLPGYRIVGYTDRMELAFAAADLAISRAGSASVSELCAIGLPAVFVPYPVGNGEQELNAAEAVGAGGALLVRDAAFTPGWVADELVPLLLDPARLAELSARIASVGHRDGADRMVDLVLRARDEARR